MQCRGCATTLAPGAKFCPECGTQVFRSERNAAPGYTADPLHDALTAGLGAQYEVLRLVGRGAMGAVYLARERLLERLVAIKVLPHEAADAAGRDQFLREARTAARLTHPNIVPLFSFGEAGETLFYIMGYVEGESLESRLRRGDGGRLPVDDVRRILAALSSALAHAHAQGVIHRDLKPDNVLIEAGTGRTVLTDFGIAKHQLSGNTLTRTGVIVGTPHYMSPEQATGNPAVDGRSDLYSLGVIGYRLLAGRLPFDGASVQELIAQHVAGEPVPLGSVAPEAPPDLVAAVSRCLAKDPATRWPSANALHHALGAEETEGASLPEDLEEMPASGTAGFAVAYGFSVGCAELAAFQRDPEWLFAIPVIVAGVLLRLAAQVHSGRKHGLHWRRLVQIAFWPIRTWWGWWPTALRRPGDVWDRLPREARVVRTALTGIGGAVAISAPALALVITLGRVGGSGPSVQLLASALRYTWYALILSLVPALGLIIVMRRKFQLSRRDLDRLRTEPTAGSRFWKRPEIARLLGNSGGAGQADEMPDTPDAVVELLAAQMSRIPEAGRDVAREALDAARQVANAVERLDAELLELSRGVDPAERSRLEDRLAALGAPRTGEFEGSQRIRVLLSGQLSMVDELTARTQTVAARREQLVQLLRALWLQMAGLGGDPAADALLDTEASGRIRAVCQSIAQEVRATAETRQLVEEAL